MKKIFITLAAVGLVLASCSKNEETGFNSQNPDAVKFTPVTSRASIAVLSTLTADADGFRVYGASGTAPSTWYTNVNGASYKYSGSWGWVGSNIPQWPIVASGYPMTFYAMHPASTPSVAIPTATPSNLTGTVTIQSTAATQVDLLAAKATTDAKPSNGTLPLTFNHILSKVNFGIIAGDATDVYVQYTGIKALKRTAPYNYVAGSWGTTSGSAEYDYYNSTTTPKATFVPSITDETTANPFYTDATHNLMLLPQTSTEWDFSGHQVPTANESYIELVYRLSNSGGEVGYGDATDHLTAYPAYVDGTNQWNGYTGISDGNNPYGSKPLFVKVGFPVTANWVSGKGYTYNVCLGTLGSTSGHYVDDTYYDEDGEDTGIPIIGPDDEVVEPGDPVADGTINFKVDVTDWDDTEFNVQN